MVDNVQGFVLLDTVKFATGCITELLKSQHCSYHVSHCLGCTSSVYEWFPTNFYVLIPYTLWYCLVGVSIDSQACNNTYIPALLLLINFFYLCSWGFYR